MVYKVLMAFEKSLDRVEIYCLEHFVPHVVLIGSIFAILAILAMLTDTPSIMQKEGIIIRISIICYVYNNRPKFYFEYAK
jgi:hypothetical protein